MTENPATITTDAAPQNIPQVGYVARTNCAIMARPCCNGTTEQNGVFFGHPRVYLDYAGKDYVDCPYCSRRFITLFKKK